MIRGSEVELRDLQAKQFLQRQRALIVFVIDASESMGQGSLERMKAAKGAILGLLTAAYQNRDQVALVSFGGERAQVLLRPTSSVLLAQQQLRKLPLGGATPFADGLWQGWQLIRTQRQKQPSLQPLLVIVSDGEANLPLSPGGNVYDELFGLALQVARDQIQSVVIDSRGGVGNEKLQQLARRLGGRYTQIRDLHAGRLIEAVQTLER
ncbi:Mg-chelatase subunit ChlD [Malonomonas rubra DSM 5091]|uniref:Mg-chelatase subunit ChlD n=1 Tax=Malonomonas rubra DSM 5091 TaxID=1122189 RepID=A0A1M6I8M7_MALRU|nr:Mg-chelatase subunit ChlD [Malonomonas rubra DSM 5091]